MKQCGIIYEYLLANNYLHKANDGNTNARCEIWSKTTINTSERHLLLKIFFKFKRFHKAGKKNQSVLTVPKVLRKLNELKNAFKRSRYRHTLSHH